MVDVIECKLGSSKSIQPLHNISFQNQVKQVKLQHSGYVIRQNNAHSSTDLPTGKVTFFNATLSLTLKLFY